MTSHDHVSPADWLDLVTHSPDGESRGLLFRVGDIFPMDPAPHHRSAIDEAATPARPWGLRYARVAEPRAGGKHKSDTSKFTTGGGDGQHPEDWDTD